MGISTFQGVVKNGQIRLRDDVTLPEDAEVYVVLPDSKALPRARAHSPRLAHPEQAADFVKQVVKVGRDADL
jgi:hypothetical protein